MKFKIRIYVIMLHNNRLFKLGVSKLNFKVNTIDKKYFHGYNRHEF